MASSLLSPSPTTEAVEVLDLFSDIPAVPADYLGYLLLGLLTLTYLANQIKKLFGWDAPASATKEEVAALSNKIADCATKAEVASLRREITDQLGVITTIQVNLERMRTELVREVAASSQRLEAKMDRLWLGGRDIPSCANPGDGKKRTV